jgi:hypothetical protein
MRTVTAYDKHEADAVLLYSSKYFFKIEAAT